MTKSYSRKNTLRWPTYHKTWLHTKFLKKKANVPLSKAACPPPSLHLPPPPPPPHPPLSTPHPDPNPTSLNHKQTIRHSFWHAMKISNWQRPNIDWVHFYLFSFFWKHYAHTKVSFIMSIFYVRNLWYILCIDEIMNLEIHKTLKQHMLCPFLISKINFHINFQSQIHIWVYILWLI